MKYAEEVEAQYILRGIRSVKDYESEKAMMHINADLNSEIITIFLMPPRKIAEVSSSAVKNMIGPEGWEKEIKRYVPEQVYKIFLKKFKK